MKKTKMNEEMENPCWDGYEPYGTKIVDGREVPNCVPIKMSKFDIIRKVREELEKKKKKYGFPIPSPKSDESQDEFISRCMSELNDEYPDDSQRAAICYNKWREK